MGAPLGLCEMPAEFSLAGGDGFCLFLPKAAEGLVLLLLSSSLQSMLLDDERRGGGDLEGEDAKEFRTIDLIS
jgi:hypothetical protein